MMKILVLSFFNPIENAPRPAQLLGILDILEDNCEVDIITKKLSINLKESIKYDLYKLHKYNIYELTGKSIFSRVINKILTPLKIDKGATFSFMAFFRAMFLFKKYDRVICITNPFSTGFSGYLLKKIGLVKKLHIDAGDPYSTHRRHVDDKFKWLRVFIEKVVCRNVDNFILPLEESLKDFPFLHDKVNIIPQIFTNRFAKCHYIFDNSFINILYAGRFYDNFRRPDSLFWATDKLISEGYLIKFHYFGIEGLSLYQKKCLDSLSNLKENIIINKTHDRENLLFIMNKCDILINIENDGLNQVPSKVIDYKLSKTLIVNISEVNMCNLEINSKNSKNEIYDTLKSVIISNDYKTKIEFNLDMRIRDYKNVLGI
jgi:hypothetical protein